MKLRSLSVILFLPLLISCNQDMSDHPYFSIAGFTQGTTYHMTYQSPTADTLDLSLEITALLAKFDQSLSTYIDTSLISRINSNEDVELNGYFIEVYNEAKRIYEVSGGAFDITVKPLIEAWGFIPGKKLDMDQERVDSIRQFVGMDKVSIADGKLIKEYQQTRIDVNAIAQGYAVDVVASYFDSKHIRNYMVEIGGELTTRGVSPRNDAWKIGIDKPVFGNVIPGQELQEVIALSGLALASSGNYRKYYELDGKKIVHTVDPKTGYTKMSNLLSVTIITKKCMTADALATTCMALGLDKAKDFIQKQEGVEALFIFTDDDGLYLEWMTDGMKQMLVRR